MTKKLSTFDLWDNSLRILDVIEHAEGEITSESSLLIKALLENIDNKADAIYWWIDRCERFEAEARENAQMFLDQRRKWRDRKAFMKDTLLRMLLQIREEQGEDPTYEASWGTARITKSVRLSIDDESLIPEQYWKEKTSRTVNKDAIKRDLKSFKYPGEPGGVSLSEITGARISKGRKLEQELSDLEWHHQAVAPLFDDEDDAPAG